MKMICWNSMKRQNRLHWIRVKKLQIIRIVMSIWDILVMFSVSLGLELLRTVRLNIFQHSLLKQEVRAHHMIAVSMAITDHHPLQRSRV